MKIVLRCLALSLACLGAHTALGATPTQTKPNIVLIYTDDVGIGDLACYGAKDVATPNIDRLAQQGLRFTDAHATSATCTPSRYSLLTGEYAWRKPNTGIARGDATALIAPGRTTLPSMLKRAGYATGAVGKWHLGLGEGKPDWNGDLKPGPLEIGFDYCFIMPATADRAPCVFVENHRVVGLDPKDPIEVSFDGPVGQEPTGKNHPELLKMKPSHGHDQTIVNGVSRIGYMSGGKTARWIDEDLADTLVRKGTAFIEQHSKEPFFLYFATHDIHVPRMPHARFVGQTSMGPRGDVIAELDWTVGEILAVIDRLKLTDNTLVIFSSDNGPVVNDGYQDQSVEKLGKHLPAGPYRGGKYSNFEGGTRVPMIVRWPKHVTSGVSPAMVSHVDFGASFASLVGQSLKNDELPDSVNYLPALLGQDKTGRKELVEHAPVLSLRDGHWKYITPGKGAAMNLQTNTEMGNLPKPQLYDLNQDPGEKMNVAETHPDLVEKLSARLQAIRETTHARN